mmetsp:Transcript_7020/g.10470  ORF Transcript_7020/g.10470 Transcript_7020/m.10470 type:complete len:174 (+) Transcript_7020:1502-2023(+)
MALTLPFIFPVENDELRPVPLLVDNLAAISTANHPKVTSASKHLQLRVFRLRDDQGDQNNIKRVQCLWVPTKYNVADFMSKLLKYCDFPRLAHFLVDNSYKPSGETTQTSLEGNYCYHNMVYPDYGSPPEQFYLNQFSNVLPFDPKSLTYGFHPNDVANYVDIPVQDMVEESS